MATVVEHDKRKQEILEKSLDVFMDEGYEDVTFQKIADRCGITRTTLYIYFKNKREIFLWSIKQLLSTLEDKLMAIATDTTISTEQVLKDIMIFILNKCVENKKLFSVLLPYLIQLQKSGINTEERVRRRTIRLQHIMNCAIIRGIR
ncbi:MAG: TetR/AcrR family transcriptional regulator, partial [Treponema sp.]|nr:TetR/AcrR family transcriptional regulator [Treponema sp.]